MPTLTTLVCVAVLALATLLATPAVAAPDADGYVTRAEDATNARRAAHDLRPLARDACLERVAAAQAARMAGDRALSHTSGFKAVLRRCGLRSAGENVAQALGSDRGAGVVGQWMRSSGHRANILDGGYRLLGMAAVRRGGSWWVVQVFGTPV